MALSTERQHTLTYTNNHEQLHEAPHDTYPEQTLSSLSERKIRLIKGGQIASLALQAAGVGLEIIRNGWSTVNTAALMGLVHDGSDVEAWRQDLKQERGMMSEVERQRSEKRAHHILFWGGSYPLGEGIAGTFGVEWHKNSFNMLNTIAALGATGIAAVTTGIIGASILKKHGSTKRFMHNYRYREKDAPKQGKRLMHGITDFVTSSAVLARTTEVASHQTSSAIMAIGAAALMLHYRPTKKNLEKGHACLHDHDHEHTLDYDYRGQVRTRGRHRKEKRGSWWRKSVVVGSVAIAACINASSTTQENTMTTGQPNVSQSETPSSVAPLSEDISQEITIQPGDSQWSIVKEQLRNTIHTEPSDEVVDAVTDMTIDMNRGLHPNPNIIQPGDCLEIPANSFLQNYVVMPLTR